MELRKLIQGLRDERDRIIRVIDALERLTKVGSQEVPKRRGRTGMAPQERQEVFQRMKKYWSSRHNEPSEIKHR